MEPTVKSKIIGLLFTATSGICFACASVFVKLSGDMPISLIILLRSLLQIASSLFLNTLFWKQSLNPKDKKLLLAGFGALCFLTIYGIYLSFQTIPLGEATVIISTTPFFVAIMERVVMSTRVSVSNMVSGLVCSAGVIILTHSGVKEAGSTSTVYLLGYSIITLATFTQAASFVLVKHINVHYVVPVFYLGVSNSIISCLMCIPQLPYLTNSSITLNQCSWLVLVSVFAVAGSFTLNKGLQHEQAAMVALVRNIDIVIAYVCDVLVFRHTFSAVSLMGACLVVMATIGSGIINICQETAQYKKLSCELADQSAGLVEEQG